VSPSPSSSTCEYTSVVIDALVCPRQRCICLGFLPLRTEPAAYGDSDGAKRWPSPRGRNARRSSASSLCGLYAAVRGVWDSWFASRAIHARGRATDAS
jgi:hypothetical protein